MMTISDRVPPEAELEAHVLAALAIAFPLIPSKEFHIQSRFVVKLGHEEHQVDGERCWEKAGRADVLLFFLGQPLAVLELKRQDKALTDEDRKQGLSYAVQLTPRPPLVIVTNGEETRLFTSADGVVFEAESRDAAMVKRLFENASKVAAAGRAWAIETLMGPEAGVWTSAVRAQTRRVIDQMAGSVGDFRKPFSPELKLHRSATFRVLRRIAEGKRLLLLTGAPLSGKSNILREVAECTSTSSKLAVLLIRAGGGGAGLFQRIANVLSAALEWNVQAADIRQWLRRLSNSEFSPILVLALDGLTANSPVAADVEELAEAGFGSQLRIMATTDHAGSLRVGSNGRDATALDQLAHEIEVEPLSSCEFRSAQKALASRNVFFTRGAAFAEDYRFPWVLRALLADIAGQPEHQQYAAALPASLGIQFIQRTRVRMATYAAQYGYRLLARDFLSDVRRMSVELKLEVAHGFVIRRDALHDASRAMLGDLITQGWLRAFRHRGGDDVVVPRAPELFLSEMAAAVSEALDIFAADDGRSAGNWLARRLDGVFMGDLIGAQALVDLAQLRGGFSDDILRGLFAHKPTVEEFCEGTFAIQLRDGTLQDIQVTASGEAFCLDSDGNAFGEAVNLSEDPQKMYSDMTGWMILSQLCRIPAIAESAGKRRVDLTLLFEIGTCPIPLMRAARDPQGHFVHEVEGHGSMLCPENGVVEPATAAMQQVLWREWKALEWWFDAAMQRNSLPLFSRILIALQQVRATSSGEKEEWADQMIKTRIEPAIHDLLATGPSEIPAATL